MPFPPAATTPKAVADPLAAEAHWPSPVVLAEPATEPVCTNGKMPQEAGARKNVLQGHETRTALDGPAALEAAQVFRPELILLDIGLPDMDGYEVARRLRTELHMDETVLIAMTGYGHEQDRRKAQAAGFNHHLVKPVDPAALQRALASLRDR
jgi:CheY-like chemotaxis protein